LHNFDISRLVSIIVTSLGGSEFQHEEQQYLHFNAPDQLKKGARRPYVLLVTKHSTCHELFRFCRISNNISEHHGSSILAISHYNWTV